MATTITELYDSGNISGDALQETRVKELLVTSDGVLHEHQAIQAAGYKIGFQWNPPGTIGGLSGGLSLNRPAGIKGSPLYLTGFRCSKVHQGVTNSLRLTLFFSTDLGAWAAKRRVEMSSKTITLYHDLDAIQHDHATYPDWEQDPNVGNFPSGGESWATIAYDENGVYKQPPAPLETWEPHMRLHRKNGAEVLRPRLTVVYSTLLFDPPMAAIAQDAFSTNRQELEGIFDGQDHWLFAGMDGEEIARNVWRAEFRFIQDSDCHRVIEYQVEPGTDIPVLDGLGRPKYRSSRVYPRSDWAWVQPTLHLSELAN